MTFTSKGAWENTRAAGTARALTSTIAVVVLAATTGCPGVSVSMGGNPNVAIGFATDGTTYRGPDLLYVAQQAGIVSAAHDIPCAAGDVQVVLNEDYTISAGGGDKIILDGCGQRLTYKKYDVPKGAYVECHLILIARLDLNANRGSGPNAARSRDGGASDPTQ